MISFSFFSVMIIISFKYLLWSTNEENILLLNHVRLLCNALHSKFFYLTLLWSFKNTMNKILRIWRYATIGIIVSLLTLSIFVLGCTTDSIPKKNKKSAVMNDPIVTYWYCWWRINRYCTVSSGFEFLHLLDVKRLHNSHGNKSERFFS